MAFNTPENWKITGYTNDTWTTLVTGTPSVVAALTICNTNAATPVDISVQVDGCTIVANAAVAAYSTQTLDLRSLVVKSGQTLQVMASAAGVHIHASGAI